jgi:hypothetical protein
MRCCWRVWSQSDRGKYNPSRTTRHGARLLKEAVTDRKLPIRPRLIADATQRATPGSFTFAQNDEREVLGVARYMSMARPLRSRHARRYLHYNWFTEGFDTADLENAKALLRRTRPLPL